MGLVMVVLLLLLVCNLYSQSIDAENLIEKRRANSPYFTPRMNLSYYPFADVAKEELEWQNLVQFKTGNEVGDPLHQELVTEGPFRNHTPLIYGHIVFENFGLVFDQPDHFAPRNTSYRLSKMNQSEFHKNIDGNLSWFGENVPHFSMVKHYGLIDVVGLKALYQISSGWNWNVDEISQKQIPMKKNKFDMEVEYADYSLNGSLMHEEGAGLLETVNYEYDVGLNLENENNGSRINIGVTWSEKKNSSYINYDLEYEYVNAYDTIRAVVETDQRELNIGSKFYMQTKDYEKKLYGGINLGLGNTKGYGVEYSGEFKKGFNGLDFQNVVFQVKPFLGVKGSPRYKLKFDVGVSPNFQLGNSYFDLDSTQNIKGYIERYGSYKYVQKSGFGFKINSMVSQSYRHFFKFWNENQFDYRGEEWDENLDYSPPKFISFLGLDIVSPTNLKVSTSLKYRTSYTLRNYTAEEFKVEDQWTVNLSITQYFLSRDLKFAAHFLDILGEEALEHPNGGLNRFRLFVEAAYLF